MNETSRGNARKFPMMLCEELSNLWVTKQSGIVRAILKNTDEEKSQLELVIQASLQAKKQNFVDRAEDIVTEPVQMARPMSMFPYNYFNPHLEHYRPPFVFSGPYTGMNMTVCIPMAMANTLNQRQVQSQISRQIWQQSIQLVINLGPFQLLQTTLPRALTWNNHQTWVQMMSLTYTL